ncbi:hypothetical protein P3H15_32825 [Rhodococcus sp. T2V]|uniref:hypothetical protein n=1 Tax=Rhodococcus sp. T2V TaxID=3034164 RepID=UPI0023E0BD9C|nr:hypothetical protein [Rhodococcus sp. T2V]MDF3309805.1 hypothetical protein [Rhodococcus sp. T2V]
MTTIRSINSACDNAGPICEGCDRLAVRVGLTLTEAHVSCRRVTVTNLLIAAQRMGELVVAGATSRITNGVESAEVVL